MDGDSRETVKPQVLTGYGDLIRPCLELGSVVFWSSSLELYYARELHDITFTVVIAILCRFFC